MLTLKLVCHQFKQLLYKKSFCMVFIAFQVFTAYLFKYYYCQYLKHLNLSFSTGFQIFDFFTEVIHPLLAWCTLSLLFLMPYLSFELCNCSHQSARTQLILLSPVSSRSWIIINFFSLFLMINIFLLVWIINFLGLSIFISFSYKPIIVSILSILGINLFATSLGLCAQSLNISPWLGSFLHGLYIFLAISVLKIEAIKHYSPFFNLIQTFNGQYYLSTLIYYFSVAGLLSLISHEILTCFNFPQLKNKTLMPYFLMMICITLTIFSELYQGSIADSSISKGHSPCAPIRQKINICLEGKDEDFVRLKDFLNDYIVCQSMIDLNFIPNAKQSSLELKTLGYSKKISFDGIKQRQDLHKLIAQLIQTVSWTIFLQSQEQLDPMSSDEFGMSYITQHFIKHKWPFTSLNLSTLNNGLPDNALTLALINTKSAPNDSKKLILNHLDAGKNLLWCIHDQSNATDWAFLLNYLNLKWSDYNLEQHQGEIYGSLDPTCILSTDYPPHPITQNLNQLTFFPDAKALYARSSANAWQIKPIIVVKTKTKIDSNFKTEIIGIRLQKDTQKIVIYSDSHFLLNRHALNHDNLKLIVQTFAWLNNQLDVHHDKESKVRAYIKHPIANGYYKIGIFFCLPLISLIITQRKPYS